jgi:Family of unknown function (DUF5670)
MLWTIAVILLVLWLLGFSFHVGGALIHLIFSDRGDRGHHQACHRSRRVGVQRPQCGVALSSPAGLASVTARFIQD